MEASSAPTICRRPDSRRHQLSAIAPPEARSTLFAAARAGNAPREFSYCSSLLQYCIAHSQVNATLVNAYLGDDYRRAHKVSYLCPFGCRRIWRIANSAVLASSLGHRVIERRSGHVVARLTCDCRASTTTCWNTSICPLVCRRVRLERLLSLCDP